ncbi:MAG: hypothetical protein RL885_02915 [Planctomycetota bacterium]
MIPFALVLCTLLPPFEIIGVETLTLDAESRAEAFSLAKGSRQTDAGFELFGAESWLETSPIAGGLSWRPPQQAMLSVTLEGVLEPERVTVSVRYGVDGRHWTKWIPLELVEEKGKTSQPPKWTGRLEAGDREAYQEQLEAWLATDTIWQDDEDAACRWIAERDPKFFAKHQPFIGWMQCRVTMKAPVTEKAVVRFKKLKLESIWAVGGLHRSPKPGSQPAYDKDWNYIAPKPEKEDDK